MAATHSVHLRVACVLGIGYLAGLLAYPHLPGPFLAERMAMRMLVAFTLPTTALAIYGLFRSLRTLGNAQLWQQVHRAGLRDGRPGSGRGGHRHGGGARPGRSGCDGGRGLCLHSRGRVLPSARGL